MSSTTSCFMCMRCEYPICSRDDLILTEVAGGTTASAFAYDLEDLLNVEDPVPCYSADETTEVSVVVSERILSLPLPPAARLLALEAVVDSRRTQLSEMDAQSRQQGAEEQSHQHEREQSETPNTQTADPGATTATETDHTEAPSEGNEQEVNPNRSSFSTHITRRGRVSKFRVDLVCVQADVGGYGLVVCEKDRGALASHAKSTEGVASGDVEDVENNAAVTGSSNRCNVESVTSSVLEASRNPPSSTKWSSHPGNFLVEESFIQVRRRTMTARVPWFESYNCSKRLECPDCHLGLGYLFVRKDLTRRCCSDAEESQKKESASGAVKGVEKESQSESTEGHEPHQKRERREDAVDESHKQTARQHYYHHHQKSDYGVDSPYPDTFIGLELKKIRQSRWGLAEFQKRYKQAQSLHTFRELFPEAEELESFYGRLTALRTQSELYNSLLRKHREQNDVQTALLQSQKDRIGTYEEKLNTMQQIIEAQKIQLEMQGRQIKHQEQLVRNHESQVMTQQHQIQVEQLLLNEQSRTINSQREQITLIQSHLRARLMKDQLQVRCGILESLLRRASHSREQQQQQQQSTTISAPYPLVTGDVEHEFVPSDEERSIPPPHLIGIIGHARDDEKVDCTRNPAGIDTLDETRRGGSTEMRRASGIDVLAEDNISPNSSSAIVHSDTSAVLQKMEEGDQVEK